MTGAASHRARGVPGGVILPQRVCGSQPKSADGMWRSVKPPLTHSVRSFGRLDDFPERERLEPLLPLVVLQDVVVAREVDDVDDRAVRPAVLLERLRDAPAHVA